jgi:tetratricopeptide (TPR) repeat protein
MSRVLLRLVLLAVVGSAAAPVRVSAQPAPAPVDKKQVARQYTEAGLAAAKLGDYDTAIGFYQKAYQLVPHPTLIFNIAEANRLAGRFDGALTLYRRYLSEAPAGPLAADARDRIAEIEAEQARKVEDARKAEDERKAAARKAEDERRAAEAREVAEAGQERERAAAVATSPSGSPDASPALETSGTVSSGPVGRNLRLAGLATGAGGLLGVVVGIGFAVHSRTLNDRVSNRPGVMFDQDTDDAGRRANAYAYVGTIGGTVLVAAGAALYWWGYTQGRSVERVSVAPVVSDRLAGLAVTGAW